LVTTAWKDRWVQGRADPRREIMDVESVAGHLLPGGWVARAPARTRRTGC